MWTIINGINQTAIVDSVVINEAINDPLTKASFQVEDIGSNLWLDFGMPVIIWDESAVPEPTAQNVPTINMLINPDFSNGFMTSQGFTTGGALSSIITFPITHCLLTFSNNDGDAYATQTTQNNYIFPGQKYMFSAYVLGTSPVNIDYYLQINWLDINGNFIANVSTAPTAPPTSQQRINVTGVAPATAYFAQVQFGGLTTVAGTNSGTIQFSATCLEPVWFLNQLLASGIRMTYPTPDCNFGQVDCVRMPDLTISRMCRAFTGYIKKKTVTYVGHDRYYAIECASLEDIMENGALINKSYTSIQDTALINDIVSTYFSGLLATGQQNSAAPPSTIYPGWLVDSASYADEFFRAVMNALADLSGFSFWIDPYGYIHYNDTPFYEATFTVNRDNPDNITAFAPIEYQYVGDGNQVRNSVKVIGGKYTRTITEQFSGDGSTKVFNLSFVPDTITSITIGGTLLAPTAANFIDSSGSGVNGVSGVVALQNNQKQQITFNTAPASGTNNVVIVYTQQKNIVILSEQNTSVAQYGRKFIAKVSDTTLTSDQTAGVRGSAEISKYAFPLINLTFKLINVYASPGVTIFFTSAEDNLINTPLTVQTVDWKYLNNGYTEFTYLCGTYVPNIIDHLRNASKAINKTISAANADAILAVHESVEETLTYGDSAIATVLVLTTAIYGSAIYGFSEFN